MLPVTILRITIFFKTLFFTYTGKENNSTAESLKSEWWIFVFNPKPFASKLSYFYLCEYEFGSVPEYLRIQFGSRSTTLLSTGNAQHLPVFSTVGTGISSRLCIQYRYLCENKEFFYEVQEGFLVHRHLSFVLAGRWTRVDLPLLAGDRLGWPETIHRWAGGHTWRGTSHHPVLGRLQLGRCQLLTQHTRRLRKIEAS